GVTTERDRGLAHVVRVPHLDAGVPARRGDAFAVGAVGHARDLLGVAVALFQGEDDVIVRAFFHIPDGDTAVAIAGNQTGAVLGVERHAENGAVLPCRQQDAAPARLRLPDAHRLIGAAGRQVLAVGAVGHAENVRGMSPKAG